MASPWRGMDARCLMHVLLAGHPHQLPRPRVPIALPPPFPLVCDVLIMSALPDGLVQVQGDLRPACEASHFAQAASLCASTAPRLLRAALVYLCVLLHAWLEAWLEMGGHRAATRCNRCGRRRSGQLGHGRITTGRT